MMRLAAIRRCAIIRAGLGPSAPPAGWESYEAAVASCPSDPIPDESLGAAMLYSSGTTGRPKGILRDLPDTAPSDPLPVMEFVSAMFGFRKGMTYLNPAPLYHSAPQASVAASLRLGATTVVMEHFDAEQWLALVERLVEEAREEMRVGLLTPTAARALLQLPAGNQLEVLGCARRDKLNTTELRGVVELLRAAAGRPQAEYVLAQPREALAQARALGGRAHDPRLSVAGNRVARQLSELLERLTRMDSWLRQRGRADLTTGDGGLLAERFCRLGGDATTVAALASDLYEELRRS